MDTSIVTVDQEGNIVGKNQGETTIVGTYGKYAKCIWHIQVHPYSDGTYIFRYDSEKAFDVYYQEIWDDDMNVIGHSTEYTAYYQNAKFKGNALIVYGGLVCNNEDGSTDLVSPVSEKRTFQLAEKCRIGIYPHEYGDSYIKLTKQQFSEKFFDQNSSFYIKIKSGKVVAVEFEAGLD